MPPIPPSEIIMAEYTSLISIFAEMRRECQSILRTGDTFVEDIRSLRHSFQDSDSSTTATRKAVRIAKAAVIAIGALIAAPTAVEEAVPFRTAPPIPSVMAITTRKVTMIEMR